MAEALVSFILEQLATPIIENARQELQLVIGATKEVKKLRRTFEAIHGVLEDAEERQIVERNVKSWLDKLKEVSYDMEDVLDEWKTAISNLQKNGVESASIPKKMVCPFISCFSFGVQVVRRHDIGTKIKEINEELDEIFKLKDRYHFVRREITQPGPLKGTTSYNDLSELKGRDDIRDKIVSNLTSEEGCIQTISIIGMGGIGKTALAQMVFNYVKCQNFFDKTVWIYVSDFFDQAKIAREILEGLDGGSSSSQNLISLQSLLDNISEKIKKIKLFIVFDDVWTERDEDWQALKAALQHCKQGSRILVTTRKESVVKVMRSSRVPLELLSDEVCWDILKHVAFTGREESECRDLEDVGMRIAKKCKGLPLAAKNLGSLLREKRRKVEWEKVLNSEFWELEMEEYVFSPLLLSYYDLPSRIRRCLLFCAIFPKDYVMWIDDLISHWKAQGFLNFGDSSDMEWKGEDYFYYLAGRSFFQDFVKDTSGNIIGCKMHDLIHDFLQFMTKDEIVAKEVDYDETLTLDSVSERARHLRIKIGQGNTFPRSISGVEKLRSLLTVGQDYDVTGEAFKKLFNEAKCLRFLEFGLSIWKWAGHDKVSKAIEVPEEIGNLIHLRHLTFHYSPKLKLPESLCELQNLQYLNLVGCNKLPDEMEKLINLKILFTRHCVDLRYYPKGIGKLAGLKRLDRVVARVDCNDARAFSVGDLENLNLLCGDLSLCLEGNSINREEVQRAKLHNKIHLTELNVRLRTLDGDYAGKEMQDNFIQALNPRPNFRLMFM